MEFFLLHNQIYTAIFLHMTKYVVKVLVKISIRLILSDSSFFSNQILQTLHILRGKIRRIDVEHSVFLLSISLFNLIFRYTQGIGKIRG